MATFEFPHLVNLIEQNQFDTIYHEHFSYLSLTAVHRILTTHGLQIFDVEEHSTHGGSLRVFAQRADTGRWPMTPAVDKLLAKEAQTGLRTADFYSGFQARAENVKNDLLRFLLEARGDGKTIAAYGAAAKGNTLLNYAGVRGDLIAFVVDRNPAKQGKYMPGSRIPIRDEAALRQARPDYVLILPWNLKDEVMQQLEYIQALGWRLSHGSTAPGGVMSGVVVDPTARVSPLCDIEASFRGTRIVIGPGVVLDSFVKIKPAGGEGDVIIGARTIINSGCVIYTGNGINIGEDVRIAANCTLAPVNHEFRERAKKICEQRFRPGKGGIVIEDDVWIGAGCVLLDGAILRRGCVIGAMSLVRGEVPAYSIQAGNPLRQIGLRT